MGGLALTPQLLHHVQASICGEALLGRSAQALAVPQQIGCPLHHAAEYLKTSHPPFQRMSEALIIYVARKHPTALIKVPAAGVLILQPAQHSLSGRRCTDGDAAAPYVHLHAECNLELFRWEGREKMLLLQKRCLLWLKITNLLGA